MNETFKIVVILGVLIFCVIGLSSLTVKEVGSEKVTHNPIPSISADENYGKDFNTYKSKLGYSFQYPDYMFITEDPNPGISERVLVLSSAINKNDIFGVVVSVSENKDGDGPDDWIKEPYSSVDLSSEANVFEIDGQNAISTDGGTWVLVNTLDNKYTLNIALLPGENGNLLFTEIGIIVSSIHFER